MLRTRYNSQDSFSGRPHKIIPCKNINLSAQIGEIVLTNAKSSKFKFRLHAVFLEQKLVWDLKSVLHLGHRQIIQ